MTTEDRKAHSARTLVKKNVTAFKWHLEDYSILEKTYGASFYSPDFQISESNWNCRLMFYHSKNAASVGVYIPVDLQYHTLKIAVSIVNVEGDWKIVTATNVDKWRCRNDSGEHTIFPFALIEAKKIFTEGCLHNDVLTILCELTMIESVRNSEIDMATQFRRLDEIVHDSVRKFYGNGFLCDVTLSVGDKKFRAHKIILAAASPVYESMFAAMATTNDTEDVKITDVEPTIFEAFLSSLYAGSIAGAENHVREILAIAVKYEVSSIMNLCERYLINNLDQHTALECLPLAHSHRLPDLKKRALAVVVESSSEIFASLPDFAALCEHPELISEIFEKSIRSAGKETLRVSPNVPISGQLSLPYDEGSDIGY